LVSQLDRQGSLEQGTSFFQENVFRWSEQFQQIPILNGYLEQGVEMPGAVGNVVFQHKLGRVPTGMIHTKATYYPHYYDVEMTDKQITIYWPYVLAATIDFWIF